MTPEDKERIARLVQQIQAENDTEKLLPLMDELNQLLGDRGAEEALLRSAKSAASKAIGEKS
jgi:hypothetical protein